MCTPRIEQSDRGPPVPAGTLDSLCRPNLDRRTDSLVTVLRAVLISCKESLA